MLKRTLALAGFVTVGLLAGFACTAILIMSLLGLKSSYGLSLLGFVVVGIVASIAFQIMARLLDASVPSRK